MTVMEILVSLLMFNLDYSICTLASSNIQLELNTSYPSQVSSRIVLNLCYAKDSSNYALILLCDIPKISLTSIPDLNQNSVIQS